MTSESLMSFADVAREANVALSTLYYLNRKDAGPETVRIGRHLRVRRADYEAWLVANEL